MRLQDYLNDTRHPRETVYARFKRFGQSIGVSMDCVRKWIYGSRRIPDDKKLKIIEVTGGKVKIMDLVRE